MTSNINALELPCVVLPEAVAKRLDVTSKSQLAKQPAVYNDLIVTLSMIRPLWTFVIRKGDYIAKSMVFDICENGERLGTLSWGWMRKGYGFNITNERIASERKRSDIYQTADPKKALATIKKMFYRRNHTELLAAGEKKIIELIDRERHIKTRHASQARLEVDRQAIAFATAQREMFAQFLGTLGKMQLLHDHEQANLEMVTVEDAKRAFASKDAAIILRVNEQYIVKLRDKVEIMDDTTLPVWVRTKLGMLKLVEDDHFISSVGCRVTAECFMVLADKEGEQL